MDLQCKINNKDEPSEIATSSNQKTVGLLAMTDLVDEILTPLNNEGERGREGEGERDEMISQGEKKNKKKLHSEEE